MDAKLPDIALAEHLAERILAVDAGKLPSAAREKCEETTIDVIGLCIAARNEDYVGSALAGWDEDGPCTAIGHRRAVSAAGAAFSNGTAAHGEDFDDTFEGGPVHAGAVIVPAVLAIGERYKLDGKAALEGIAVGIELMCRLGLVAPKMVHKAGFHPTAVFGAMGAAAAVAKALKLDKKQIVDALGVVGSMASGIIEYLAEGTWTKRMHAGWAAQSGMRAALLARAGFSGPRTVFEGVHGFFHGFANTTEGNFDAIAGDFGTRWLTQSLAFKLYPCGTMTHPYIDCARRLGARGIKPDDVVEMVCDVGEGTVHRLWEPLAAKQEPKNGYSGKILAALLHRRGLHPRQCRLERFLRRRGEGACRGRAREEGPLPHRSQQSLSGQLHRPHQATLRDGSVIEERQPHMRGGAHEPLSRKDIEDKFLLNARHGGYDAARAKSALDLAKNVLGSRIDLSPLRG